VKTLRPVQTLAEKQTVSVSKINSRVSVRRREYEPGMFTNDILVDGKAGARIAISDKLIHSKAYAVAAQYPDPAGLLDEATDKHLTAWLRSRFVDWEDKKAVFLDYLGRIDAEERSFFLGRGWNVLEDTMRNDWPEKFV